MIDKMIATIRRNHAARRQHRELRHLRALEPRILRDIGVTEGQVDEAMRRLKYWV